MALVLKSAKREATSVGRCVAISSLALYVYCQLAHGTKHTKVKEAIAVLLAVLKVRIMGTNFTRGFQHTLTAFICTKHIMGIWLFTLFCYPYSFMFELLCRILFNA